MKKFEKIFNSVIEELVGSSSVSVNPQQVSADLKKVMAGVNPATKKALQSIADPIDASTETNPDDELISRLDNLDFEKLPTDKKEKILLSLMKKGILKDPQNNTQQTTQQTTSNNPAAYGV
jgi:hypothetical protein